jgi:hypothetical protein
MPTTDGLMRSIVCASGGKAAQTTGSPSGIAAGQGSRDP